MKTILKFFIIFQITAFQVSAQMTGQTGEAEILLRREKYAMLTAHTAGFGFSYRQGKHITGSRKRMYEIEFSGVRHPKQVRTLNYYYHDSKSYFYGKLNHMYTLRPGIGFQHVLTEKPYWGGIEVRSNAYLGASVALLKPVYLVIAHEDDHHHVEYMQHRYDPAEHFVYNIAGRGNFFKGMNQMKAIPGGYLKYALNFDLGASQEIVRGIELGISADVYARKIPLMAFQDNQNIFLFMYVSLVWGIRQE
jgi:hypothetical protein